MATEKLYLSLATIDWLRNEASREGYNDEQFEKWLIDCVVIVEPLY